MKNLRHLRNAFTAVRQISSTENNNSMTLAATAANSIFIEPGTSTPKPQPSQYNSFYAKDLKVIEAQGAQLQEKPMPNTPLKFGHIYSDHMAEADWDEDIGWTKPLISPLHEFKIHPGSKVLHYAIQLFEGMKAYRGIDNRIRLFRPELNMARMRKTAQRSALPDFSSEELIKIISELVRIDKEWVPYSNTSSLYLRPTLIGTDNTLGVGYAKSAKLFVVSGPVGTYYSTGFQPITLYADSSHIRAFPGGVGQYKMGCNYAPTICVAKRAVEMGCQQVLWLYGEDQKLTEVGTMNIFVYWENEYGEEELVTPPLTDGLILPGVTRNSLLELVRDFGHVKISERYPTMDEVRRAIAEKRIRQIFGAGTACVVSPVGRILYRNPATNVYENLEIPTMSGEWNLMQRLHDIIIDIQYGRNEMKQEWVHIIE